MTAKAIMVQGTMSNVGKSLITAGLCRIFKQDGYKVAPFKSQNMALNSFITKEGLEMGRAQVMQAEAAGIEPRVSMNPILLKPTSDQGSQVIVNGEVWGDMGAKEYYRRKQELIPHIRAAYESLAREYDIVVLEGAGSPAEINLKSQDIVNMGMAKMADAPVILVGDIDRGGVFASLVGTLMLLDPDEQKRVKGILINKFRGDVQILRPGLAELEKMTGVPVLGVVPHLALELDDEDSLSERLEQRRAPGLADIAVISLPHLSNFTDFNVFDRIPGVSLRYVKSPGQLQNPDLIILPGSKNTMDDLTWLRQSGLEGEILRAARRETLIVGVCGGYQMLGAKLSDPFGVEHGGEMAGMGLLNAATVFQRQKVRTQVKGQLGAVPGAFSLLSGQPVSGYEIHMGETQNLGGCRPLAEISEVLGAAVRQADGLMNEQGTVFGTYIHGLFDSEGLAFALVSALLQRKGLGAAALEDASEWRDFDTARFKDHQYDILAGSLRSNLAMERIYALIGEDGKGGRVMAQGLVHLYCGDGKGKTTAALGLALRAAGHGLKVMLVQFLKSADTGELKVLPNLPGCRVIRGKGGQKFSSAMSAGEKAETCLIHNQNLQTAIAEAKAGNCDVLILDEAVSALSRGMLNREELIGFIKDKPPGLELILTGRDPDPELLELADYVTKMKKVKHPFDRGIKARRGIEK